MQWKIPFHSVILLRNLGVIQQMSRNFDFRMTFRIEINFCVTISFE